MHGFLVEALQLRIYFVMEVMLDLRPHAAQGRGQLQFTFESCEIVAFIQLEEFPLTLNMISASQTRLMNLGGACIPQNTNRQFMESVLPVESWRQNRSLGSQFGCDKRSPRFPKS